MSRWVDSLPFNLSNRGISFKPSTKAQSEQIWISDSISGCLYRIFATLEDTRKTVEIDVPIFNSDQLAPFRLLQQKHEALRASFEVPSPPRLKALLKKAEKLETKVITCRREILDMLHEAFPPENHVWQVTLVMDGNEYEISYSDKMMSKGGYGEIYRGTHEKLGRLVLKRASIFAEPDHNAKLRRTLREASIWKSLKHPHVLPFMGECRVGDNVFLVAPYAEYGTLLEFVVGHPKCSRDKLLRNLADALVYLHTKAMIKFHDGTPDERGIVHGDIKGANALVTGPATNPHVYLCDFGLSKGVLMETSLGQGEKGTDPYMSPERLLGGSRTLEADVYAFGITIAEIMKGGPPYLQATRAQYIISVTHRKERPECDEGLIWEIAKRCWATFPENRPTMTVAYGWLAALVDGKEVELPPLEPEEEDVDSGSPAA